MIRRLIKWLGSPTSAEERRVVFQDGIKAVFELEPTKDELIRFFDDQDWLVMSHCVKECLVDFANLKLKKYGMIMSIDKSYTPNYRAL